MGQGMTSNSPRRIFNKWDSTGLPALKTANTDGIYIGDIKFGEALPAGTNVIGAVTFGQIASGVNVIGAVTFGQLPAGTRNIGDVDILTIAAGETHMGEVGVSFVTSTASVLVSTTQYTALDTAASGQGTRGFLEFEDAVRVAGGKGVVRSAMFTDAGGQNPNFDLVLYSTVPATDSSAVEAKFGLADADLAKVCGIITTATGDWKALNDNSICYKGSQTITFDLSASTSLYGSLRAVNDYDAAAAEDISITLGIEQG